MAARRDCISLPTLVPEHEPRTVPKRIAYGHLPKTLCDNRSSYTLWMLSLPRRGFGGLPFAGYNWGSISTGSSAEGNEESGKNTHCG